MQSTRKKNRGASVVLAGAAALMACGGSDSLTDQTQQPMLNGTLDLGNLYPHVARLPGCSGTLVTNKHVLTARHCFSAADVTGSVPVSFFHGPSEPSDQFDFPHTLEVSGPIRTRNAGSTEQDIAIVPLDVPVPMGVALPQRIAGFRGEAPCH